MAQRKPFPRCTVCHKLTYPRKSKALEVIRGMQMKGIGRKKPGVLHAYKCAHGEGWHVGHTRWEMS